MPSSTRSIDLPVSMNSNKKRRSALIHRCDARPSVSKALLKGAPSHRQNTTAETGYAG